MGWDWIRRGGRRDGMGGGGDDREIKVLWTNIGGMTELALV